ncbi:MAG: TIGR04283 family arsenosugar biosynthesis glycosyltransferase [Gammaproteobacteria bacterium]|nr:TIGR04283 family arsenosugar biosynthesis glycosyltransferase [Gammaproteobacteria bacterium]
MPAVPSSVSVVVPVLNDAPALRTLLGALDGADLEVIVVDGGSRDGSAEVAERTGARVIQSAASRGLQLDIGHRAAAGDWVWMLHADAAPSPANLAEAASWPSKPPGWGCFGVRLDGAAPLKLVAWLMNRRSALTGICTGDQGLFAHRQLLDAIGGVPRQPLMEDVELSKRLRRLAPPSRAATQLSASGRRWQRHGAAQTIAIMWWLRARYALGASADDLYRRYYGR